MHIFVECSQPTIFNSCEGVVSNIKWKLTREKTGKLKNFGYGAIVILFYLENITLISPQQVLVDAGGIRDPHMIKWVRLMALHDGDGLVVSIILSFFYGWNVKSS